MDLSFPKEQRLYLRKDINSLLESGDVLFKYPFKVYYKVGNGSEVNRVMFSVPKKNFKRAVKRNLLKRRQREAYRHNKFMLESDVKTDLLFVYISKEIYGYDRIVAKIQEIMEKLNQVAQKSAGVAIHPAD
ncbi:MAG: ribonuclease P protein component [Bacteroidales bacterium]|nr:ribonuclease P protein component [Bacteroidales bacterium]MDD4670679.1 ribonuclease P protein component [Bacteroidales bacterium]